MNDLIVKKQNFKISEWNQEKESIAAKLSLVDRLQKLPHHFIDMSFLQPRIKLILRKDEVKAELNRRVDEYYEDLVAQIDQEQNKTCQKLLENLKKLNINEIMSQLKPGEEVAKDIDFYSQFVKLQKTSFYLTCNFDHLSKCGQYFEIVQNPYKTNNFITNYFGDMKNTQKSMSFEANLKFYNYSPELLHSNDLTFSCMEITQTGLIFLSAYTNIFCDTIPTFHGIIVIDQLTNKILKTIPHNSVKERAFFMTYDEVNRQLVVSTINEIKILDSDNETYIKSCKIDYIKNIKLFQNGDILSCNYYSRINDDKVSPMKLWDRTNFKSKKLIDLRSTKCFDIDQNGDIIIGFDDGSIKVLDPQSGLFKKSFKPNRFCITCLKILPNNQIVFGFTNKMLELWDLNAGIRIKMFIMHKSGVNCVELLDSETIISGCHGGEIRIWNLNSGLCLRTLEGHKQSIIDIQVNDGIIYSLDEDKLLKWNLNF